MALSIQQAISIARYPLRKEEEYYYHYTHEMPRLQAEGIRPKDSTTGGGALGLWTFGDMETAMSAAVHRAEMLRRNPIQTRERGFRAGVVAVPRSVAERYGTVVTQHHATDFHHIQLDEGTMIPPEELVFHEVDG